MTASKLPLPGLEGGSRKKKMSTANSSRLGLWPYPLHGKLLRSRRRSTWDQHFELEHRLQPRLSSLSCLFQLISQLGIACHHCIVKTSQSPWQSLSSPCLSPRRLFSPVALHEFHDSQALSLTPHEKKPYAYHISIKYWKYCCETASNGGYHSIKCRLSPFLVFTFECRNTCHHMPILYLCCCLLQNPRRSVERQWLRQQDSHVWRMQQPVAETWEGCIRSLTCKHQQV